MKKTVRTIALVVANLGIIVSAVYLVFYILEMAAPDFLPVEVGPDFFVVDYLYLVIPALCLLSGILMQVVSFTSPTAPEEDLGQNFDPEADPFTSESDDTDTTTYGGSTFEE